jgi:hypothetical protein
MKIQVEIEITEADIKLIEGIASGKVDKELIDEFKTTAVAMTKLRRSLGAKNTAHLVSIAYQSGILNVK